MKDKKNASQNSNNLAIQICITILLVSQEDPYLGSVPRADVQSELRGPHLEPLSEIQHTRQQDDQNIS